MAAARALAIAVLAAGCGTSHPASNPAPVCTPAIAAAVDMVRLADYAFEPACFTVPAGTSVTFFDDDSIVYRIATEAGQADGFDSGILAPGAIYRHTFATAGTIALYCTLYTGMTATAIVIAP